MRISSTRIKLTKRHPLTISRGTVTGSVNVVVRVEHEGVVGLGEMAPSDVTGDTADSAEAAIASWTAVLERFAPWETQRIAAEVTGDTATGSATRAALDVACHDWVGRCVGRPLWQLLGIDRARTPLTSLTIGIDSTDVLRDKVTEILQRTQARILKVKLGQAAGIEADQDMFETILAAAKSAGHAPIWRVDANGGWTLNDAVRMIAWLAERNVEMVEQPLPQGAEDELLPLFGSSPLPVFADESVRTSADVVALADRVYGVNLKLMKCGGIAEGLRIIHTARALRLKVMIGCMGESSLAIGAAAQLGGLVDALDLDSHLNLLDDPFVPLTIADGRVLPTDLPGIGVDWLTEHPNQTPRQEIPPRKSSSND